LQGRATQQVIEEREEQIRFALLINYGLPLMLKQHDELLLTTGIGLNMEKSGQGIAFA
jgi:hypothetical protein